MPKERSANPEGDLEVSPHSDQNLHFISPIVIVIFIVTRKYNCFTPVPKNERM
jgi:hypothetical protein